MNHPSDILTADALSRRHFLKKGSTAMVGGALLGTLAAERFAHAASTDELKIALIGCGGRGRAGAQHLQPRPGQTRGRG